MDVELITFETKCVDFMRFSSTLINLLEIFRIISFVFDLKYLSQNPQDKQFLKLSLTKNTIFDSRGGVEGQEFLKKT